MAPEKDLSYAQKLLLDLRQSYINDLPSQFDELEQMVFAMKSSQDFDTGFQELYRRIHSIKGSAGTHGLAIVSRICHQFEDQLNLVDGKQKEFTDHIFNSWLKYVDLLRESLHLIRNNDEKFASIEEKLDALRSSTHTGECRILIVQDSKSTGKLCQQALANLRVNITTMDDGFDALELLLNRQYDILITSVEIKRLNGVGLISALKMSKAASINVKTVLLTSRDRIATTESNKPDHILKKDINLVSNLHQIVSDILENSATSV